MIWLARESINLNANRRFVSWSYIFLGFRGPTPLHHPDSWIIVARSVAGKMHWSYAWSMNSGHIPMNTFRVSIRHFNKKTFAVKLFASRWAKESMRSIVTNVTLVVLMMRMKRRRARTLVFVPSVPLRLASHVKHSGTSCLHKQEHKLSGLPIYTCIVWFDKM